jgi:3-methylfumaryl-CoA hydratase
MPNSSEINQRTEACAENTVRRVTSMLNIDPAPYQTGAVLPRGWHFILMGADTPRSDIRSDGFAGLGVPMPDLGLPRLLLASRTVHWFDDIKIGTTLQRQSKIQDVVHKSTSLSRMAFVTVVHELQAVGRSTPALRETQTFALLAPREMGAQGTKYMQASTDESDICTQLIPDETTLFQYSALGFNSHKIHIDKSFARDVEGFPDLVVNGGLTTLWMTEFLREQGLQPVSMQVRYLAPLFCGHTVTLTARQTDAGWLLRAIDQTGMLAVEMKVQVS